MKKCNKAACAALAIMSQPAIATELKPIECHPLSLSLSISDADNEKFGLGMDGKWKLPTDEVLQNVAASNRGTASEFLYLSLIKMRQSLPLTEVLDTNCYRDMDFVLLESPIVTEFLARLFLHK